MSTNTIIQTSKNWSDAIFRLRNRNQFEELPKVQEPRSMGVQIPEIKVNWQAIAQSIGIYTLIYISTDYAGLDFLFLFISLYASTECVKGMIRVRSRNITNSPTQSLDERLNTLPGHLDKQVENFKNVARALERKSGARIL